MTADRDRVGLMLGSQIPPEQIRETARLGEELGFAELWLAEDYFFTGGISTAAVALAATSTIPVGLGIVSAVARHPAVLAMECATLARMFPGRLRVGIGLGLPDWLRQMGIYPKSQLGAMRESLGMVRRLLDGEEVTESGGLFHADRIQLAYPVSERVPVFAGVLAPKMLGVAGECADGTVGSVLASVEYVEWAREQIDVGRARAGRTEHHPFHCYAIFSVDEDSAKAKEALRPVMSFYLSVLPRSPLGDAYGITDELVEMAEGGAERIAREMPDRWLEDLAIVGNPEECAAQIRRLMAAGADSVVLFPMPAERSQEIVRLAAEHVLPLLEGRTEPARS